MPQEPEVLDLQPATKKDLVGQGHTFDTITDQISNIPLKGKMPLLWYGCIAAGLGLMGLLGLVVTLLFAKGVGIWGIRIPVGWGWAITNFVWWIGIGHAGTLISAILLLLNQEWRNSINRFAEAMTLFAVMCAGMFPLLHMGRPWLFYWMFPYPNAMGIQPQFRSPLVWDVFAVSTYFTVSLLFWFVGMLPDLGTLRDKAKNPVIKRVYGALSMGWRGSAYHWNHWESACLLLAGLATPLVLSVHTVVSFDFTIAIVPGWHSTFFPPYFVAGAIYSGFAMVLALGIPMRSAFHLKGLITDKHLDNCGKVMLATGLIVAYAYIMETFTAWYSGSVFETQAFWNRMTGPYAGYYWFLLTCNIAAPQALWFKRIRQSPGWLFAWSIIVLTGMWLERFVIIVSSLAQDFLPSSWGYFHPTRWDFATFIGTLGFFTLAFFLFVRLLPSISMNEIRTLIPQAKVEHEEAHVK